MKILLLSPHPDDIEFSIGGYLLKLLNDENNEITLWLFSDCDIILEWYQVIEKLKIKYRVEKNISVRKFHKKRQYILDSMINMSVNLKPDIVFCPSMEDNHQDHQVIAQEAFRAFKFTTLIGYIQPHNLTEIRPNYFVELTEEELQAKVDLISIYKSQTHRNYSRPEAIKGTAAFYGAMTGRKYCEAFEIIRKFE
jgi:N-acetylglucosamine malate deacetylase 1